MISLEKSKILTPLHKLPKNVGKLGKIIVARGIKCCPKCNKSPNLVTLLYDLTMPYWNKSLWLGLADSSALFQPSFDTLKFVFHLKSRVQKWNVLL